MIFSLSCFGQDFGDGTLDDIASRHDEQAAGGTNVQQRVKGHDHDAGGFEKLETLHLNGKNGSANKGLTWIDMREPPIIVESCDRPASFFPNLR